MTSARQLALRFHGRVIDHLLGNVGEAEQMGREAGALTVLVLSGTTSESDPRADLVVPDIGALRELL